MSYLPGVMMAELGVTPTELGAVSSELQTLAAGMRSGLGSLDSDVAGLMGSGWSGTAATAYAEVWREWHDGAHQVVEGLLAMSSLLSDAAMRYATTDAGTAADVEGAEL
jgi:WXG100 family type VII secretion target